MLPIVPLLKHICEEIFTVKNQRQIEKLGIKSIGDLLEVQLRISNGELSELKDEMKEKLVKAASWVSCNKDKDVMTSFNEDVFEEFFRNNAAAKETLITNDMSTEKETARDKEMQVGAICVYKMLLMVCSNIMYHDLSFILTLLLQHICETIGVRVEVLRNSVGTTHLPKKLLPPTTYLQRVTRG